MKTLTYRHLKDHILDLGIPHIGQFELTHRCNLKCVHCYITHSPYPEPELTLNEIKRILREIRDTGCMEMTYTGGEVYARPDFEEILLETKKLGFATVILSNVTMLTAKRIRRLQELGVMKVETTFYGTSSETYERTTGIKGSYRKFRKTLAQLIESGMEVRVKFMALTTNWKDREEFERIARDELGIKNPANIQSDHFLFSRTNGDRTPLKYLADHPEQVQYIENYKIEKAQPVPDCEKKTCAAGRTTFGIKANGIITPCGSSQLEVGNLRHESFVDIWHRSARLRTIRKLRASDYVECFKCKIRSVCPMRCPAMSYNITGDAKKAFQQSCIIARKIDRGELIQPDLNHEKNTLEKAV